MATISKELCQTLRAEMNAALQAIAAKHGLAVSIGNARYSADFAKFAEVTFANASLGVSNENAAFAAAFRKHGPKFGFTMADLGAEVKIPGQALKFTITGMKNSFITLQGSDNKPYRVKIEQALRFMGRQNPRRDFGA